MKHYRRIMSFPEDPYPNDTNENIPDQEIERLLEWEEEGINTYLLRYLFHNDKESYERAKIEVMKKQLEGELPELINNHLLDLFGEVEEDESGPLLLGRPLKDIEEEMENLDRIVPPDMEREEPKEDLERIEDISEEVRPPKEDKEDLPEIDHKRDEKSSEVTVDEERTSEKQNISHDHGTRGRVPKRKKHLIIIGGISVIVVILLVGAYMFIPITDEEEPDEPDPHFEISNNYPTEGSIVTLQGVKQNDEYAHFWSITPDNYQIIQGSLESDNITLTFTRSGEYRITHEVASGEETEKKQISIEVTQREIRVSRERYGDRMSFNVDGMLNIEDFQSYTDLPESSNYKSAELEFSTRSARPQTIEISNVPTSDFDGFSDQYQMVERLTDQTLIISGSITDWQGTKIPFSGESEMAQRNLIDLHYKRPVRSDIQHSTDITISVNPSPKKYSIDEEVKVFPRMGRNFENIRLEDISKNRVFTLDNDGVVEWGSTTLNWKAENVQIIDDLPCINVTMNMDQAEMDKFDLDQFRMNLWIADSYPVAIKTSIMMSTSPDSANKYSLVYDQKLKSFTAGDDVIIYETSDSRHDLIEDITMMDSRFQYQFDGDFDYVPSHGNMSSSIPSEFTAEYAIDQFKDKNLFKKYLESRDDPFCLKSNFSTPMDSSRQWSFTISEEDERYGWNETVREDFETGALAQIKSVSISKNDLGPLLTYSGSEASLKMLLKKIDPSMANRFYGVSSPDERHIIDVSKHPIITEVERPYPTVGMINPTLVEPIPCGFVIESFDNSAEVCVDMQTGQICYVYSGSIQVD